MPSLRTWFMVVFAVLALTTIWAMMTDDPGPTNPFQEDTQRDPARIPGGLTLAYLIVSVVLIFVLKLDAFAQGSLVVLATIQTFVFLGWLNIPSPRLFMEAVNVTIATLVLLLVVVLFHFLQRKKK